MILRLISRFSFGFIRRLVRPANPNDTSARGAAASTLAEMSSGMRAQAKTLHEEIVAVRKTVPPLELVRVPSDDRAWLTEPEAARRVQALHNAGFIDGAMWSYVGIANLTTLDLIDPTGTILASVTRQGTRFVLELEQHMADGRICNAVDIEPGKGITPPPWRHPQYRPGTAPEVLIADFIAEAPTREPVRGSIEELRQRGADAFHRLQIWRAERGGWSLAETRAQHGLAADAPLTDELAESWMKVRERWLTGWLRLQPNLTFDLDAQLGSIICVHDNSMPDLLLLQWIAVTGDEGVRRRNLEEGNPRQVFERLNQSRGAPLARVLQKTTEPAADFYLPQTQPRLITLEGPFGDALNTGLRRKDLRRSLFELGDLHLSTREEAEAICQAISHLEASPDPIPERDIRALIRLVTRSAEGSEGRQHLQENALEGLERLAHRAKGQAGS